jgi:hypothetical protein
MGTVADPGQGGDERHELVAGEHALQLVEHLRGPAGEVVADDRRQVEIRRRHVHTTPEGGSRDPTWAAPTARPTRSRGRRHRGMGGGRSAPGAIGHAELEDDGARSWGAVLCGLSLLNGHSGLGGGADPPALCATNLVCGCRPQRGYDIGPTTTGAPNYAPECSALSADVRWCSLMGVVVLYSDPCCAGPLSNRWQPA